MKLLLLSDVHLLQKNPVCRLDDLLEVQWEKFNFILQYSYKHKLKILQAGDLFDTPRSYLTLQRILHSFHNNRIKQILCVNGQHDMYLRSTDAPTNMNVLKQLRLVFTLNDQPCNQTEKIAIYGASWNDSIPEIINKTAFNILVIHAPISDKENNFSSQSYEKYLKKYEFDLILCGDIHSEFVHKNNKGQTIINTGPMVRDTVDLINHDPCFYVFDTKTKTAERISIPSSLGENVISREHIEKAKNRKASLNEFVTQLETIKKAEGKVIDIKKIINNLLKDCNDNVKEIINNTMEKCDKGE